MPTNREIIEEGRRKLVKLEEQLREAKQRLQEIRDEAPGPSPPEVVNRMAEFQETTIRATEANIAAVAGALATLEDLDEQ